MEGIVRSAKTFLIFSVLREIKFDLNNFLVVRKILVTRKGAVQK